jgi:hypothetical protein
MANNQNSTKVITGVGRLTYAFVWKPSKMDDDSEPKYSTSFLIRKDDKETVAKVKAAIQAAAEQGMEKLWGGKLPKKDFKIPLRDGDLEIEEKGEEYAGHWFINASSKRQPGIVDKKREAIEDEGEVYSGCYARLSVNFYPFDVRGNKGVACGLNNVQKIADGEPLGGARIKAEDDFDVWIGDKDGDLFDEEDSGNGIFADLGKAKRTNDLPFGADDTIAA